MMGQLPLALFFMRISIFIVMFMWALDKFINPVHASVVYSTFYYIKGLEQVVMYVIGFVEMVILVGFLLGVKKKITYGLVFLFHFVSTASTYNQYMHPYDGINLLFFTALPMLAACYALFCLRRSDTIMTLRTIS